MMTYQLPTALAPLAEAIEELAADLRWTWSHAGDAVWEKMDPETWEQTENPYVVLQNLSQERLHELERDSEFKTQLMRLAEARAAYCKQRGWYGETHGDGKLKGIAYLSMEYGLGKALPLYAGGLGVLAGDYLKTASDLGIPVVGIGLLYHEGYFRQVLDADGWQKQFYPYNDPTILPIRPVYSETGGWLHIGIHFPGRRVRFRVWQAQVGRVPLYLLDSNDPLNSPSDRGITTQLYGGGQERRLVQEIALGIGGWRLIETLGLEVEVCHLNEGHAAFLALERASSHMARSGLDFWESLWATRPGNLFTTHTPVVAGFDRFSIDLLLRYAKDYAEHLGVDLQELIGLGRRNPRDMDEPFNMAILAMRACGAANGVSRLHGEVSKGIFQPLYPRWPQAEVPVDHVTNGVHMPSWDSPAADELWTCACGKERWLGSLEDLGCAIEQQSDEALWELRGNNRRGLVSYARQRLARHLGYHGADAEVIAQAENVLDPNALTLGFARRFVEYKRPNLLLRDPERFLRLLTDKDRPVQIIVAGKADPADEEGKRFVQEWARFAARSEARIHAVFLEDYDIAVAQEMVQGVDLWINTPRRPWEASGTSGMKVLVNGGLNLSVLDGWWFEAFSPEMGWALSDDDANWEPARDKDDAERLYRLLEQEIVPAFYNRDASGIPRDWVARMRASMAWLAPRFSSNRMVRDYLERFYIPAATAFRRRGEAGGCLAKALRSQELTLRHYWDDLHWGNLDLSETKEGWRFEVQVYLGDVSPDFVQVQLYADPPEAMESPDCHVMERGAPIAGAANGYLYALTLPPGRPASDYTPRVVAHHPEAQSPMELGFILWWSGERR